MIEFLGFEESFLNHMTLYSFAILFGLLAGSTVRVARILSRLI